MGFDLADGPVSEGTFVRPLELDAGYVGDRVEGEGVETVVESV